MKIGEVAERTGLSPTTLRYYEDIGLLPRPARAPASHRQYDGRTVERARFITRAKQLGCSLKEIGELVAAFETDADNGRAARSHLAVTRTLAVVNQRLDELLTLKSELERLAAALPQACPGVSSDECPS